MEKERENVFFLLVFDWVNFKGGNWWGPSVFFLGPPKCYLPNLGKK